MDKSVNWVDKSMKSDLSGITEVGTAGSSYHISGQGNKRKRSGLLQFRNFKGFRWGEGC